ncbi:forkhead box protein M1 isoform X2 [Eleutherodactylus coqui]|uniref:forkhead box protein M1 isoform X2 n=1 Tax=Eleutherodactylus coqui TaxID=57060 RepID=UPI0034618E03
MRSSPRRPLILRRRRLNLPNQDGVSGTGAPEQRQTAVIDKVESQKQNTNLSEPILSESATPEVNRPSGSLADPSQDANVGTATSSAESPTLSGVKIMGHPTIPDTQLVVIPPDSDVERIIQALTVRGRESSGPNKFILLTGGSSSFHTQVEKLGLQSKVEEIETVQLEATAAAPPQIIEEEKNAVSKEGLDGSLTNIHWLGKMRLGSGDGKADSAEEETSGTDSLKVEEEHKAPAASHLWQVGAFERPPYSYMALIQFAINSTTSKRMTLKDIYTWIEEHFPYFRHVAKPGWKNSIRHNLSLHDMFVRESPANNKISYWTIHPQANRCLTLDQVFKAPGSSSSACSEQQRTPELSRSAQGIPGNAKAPERKMKPLLPRIDSYLIPVQFPVTQPLLFSTLETFSPDLGVSDGPRSCKRVKIAPKVLLETEATSPLAPVKSETDSLKSQTPLGFPRRQANGSRRKQQLVTPRSQEPELVLPDNSASDSGLDNDFSFLEEAPSQLTQDEGSSFKTPVKEKFMKPPASSTPSKPIAEASCLQPWEAESPLARDPLTEFSPVRVSRSAALTPFKDNYGTLSFWETPFKDLPYFGSPLDVMSTCSPASPQTETLETPTGARKRRSCSKELQVGGSSNRSLLEGLVLDTKDESLSKILLDISFSGMEEENSIGTDSTYWGQLFNELR